MDTHREAGQGKEWEERQRERRQKRREERLRHRDRVRQTDRERGGRVILEHRIPIFLERLIFQF